MAPGNKNVSGKFQVSTVFTYTSFRDISSIPEDRLVVVGQELVPTIVTLAATFFRIHKKVMNKGDILSYLAHKVNVIVEFCLQD